EPARFERILICTAAGEPGERDVRIGGRLARLLGASVTLLYITREESRPPALARGHLDRALATLRGLDVPGGLKVRAAPSPSDGILAEADSGRYDLIVLGGHGRRARFLFEPSDVTVEVITRCDRPVLVIPPGAV